MKTRKNNHSLKTMKKLNFLSESKEVNRREEMENILIMYLAIL
jgi:hypothetical protein